MKGISLETEKNIAEEKNHPDSQKIVIEFLATFFSNDITIKLLKIDECPFNSLNQLNVCLIKHKGLFSKLVGFDSNFYDLQIAKVT